MIPQKRCQSFLTGGYMDVWQSQKRVILKQRGKGETASLEIFIKKQHITDMLTV